MGKVLKLAILSQKSVLVQFFSYHKGQITDFDVLKGPLAKKLHGGSRLSHGVYMCYGAGRSFAATLFQGSVGFIAASRVGRDFMGFDCRST